MKYIDLSHPLKHNMPHYPGDEKLTIHTVNDQQFSVSTISMSVHNGTHLDVPKHFLDDTRTVKDFPVEQFTGIAWVFDVRGQKEIAEFDAINQVKPGDIVLFYTGHAQYFNAARYYQNYPVLSKGLVEKLVKMRIKMIGLDTPSPDVFPHQMHKVFMQADVIIIENLTNLDKLPLEKPFQLFAFPLALAAEASPVRVVALAETS